MDNQIVRIGLRSFKNLRNDWEGEKIYQEVLFFLFLFHFFPNESFAFAYTEATLVISFGEGSYV